jgi:hypothetical protein
MAITPIPVRLPPGAPIDVASTDNQTPAVQGTSLASAWRFPIPTPFGGAIGVIGTSGSGVGVQGTSETGAGVLGTSQNYDGVHGESQSNGHPGVSGVNTGSGPDGMGVYGISSHSDGVVGWSHTKGRSGVSGTNDGEGGYGVWANSPKGTGIIAQGNPAGYFGGDVEVHGNFRHYGDHHCTGTVTVDKGLSSGDHHCTGTVTVDKDLTVNGNHHCGGTLTVGRNINISSGGDVVFADCAERFDVACDMIIEAGAVMVIHKMASLSRVKYLTTKKLLA